MPSYYSAVDRGYRLRLDLTQVSQDIANNTSLVSYALVLEATTSYFQNFRCTVNLTIESVSVFSNTSLNVSLPSTYSSVTLTSGQRTISHNADGSKNLSFVANFSVNSPQWYTPAGTMTINDSMALTTIPRASVPTLSVSTQVMGNAITINTNRASTSFTHTLKYVFGNQSGTIATGVTTSHAWTLPLALANAIPNNESGSGTIICETYNGATLIGTKSVSFTATVPTSVVPTINSVTIAEAVSGLAVKFLGYVQSKSRLNVVTSASGAYSSTISLIRITIESKNYNGSNITTDILTGSGTLVLSVLVTDSRGRSVTQNINVTVIAYTNPVINSMDAYRVNGSGVPSDDGTSIAVPINFAIASVNSRNDKTWTLQYRVVGAPSWSSLSSGSVYTYNQTYTNLTGLFSGNNSYEIRLTITDYFTSIERIVTIGTAFTLINFRHTGKGMAIGKVSESDTFEVALLFKALEVITAEKGVAFRDTRSAADIPSELPPKAISFDFKSRASVGNPPVEASASSTYAHIITVAGWNTGEGSGGWPIQLSIGNTAIAVRQATSATTWGSWTMVGAVDLSGYTPILRTLTAGNGLTGGGTLEANRTFTLGTPGTITPTSTNGVTATSHTHAINFDVVHSHGSNSNGSWIRFTNGIQICWFNDTGSINASTTTGTQTSWNSKAFTFPAAFNAVPMIASDAFRNGGSLGWTAIQERSATGCSVYILSDFTTQSLLSYMAIGTWS